MTNRVIYLVPDHAEPAGGIRAIYRHVELLVQTGLDAAVWHCAQGFECGWFVSSAPVLSGPTLAIDETDLLIIPEVMLSPENDPAPGCRKIIYNQNHFYTFDFVPPDGYPGWTPTPSVWVSSAASLDVLRRVHAELPVELIPYSIDLELFHPRPRRERQVAWMPRKRPREAAVLQALFRADERFTGVALAPVDGFTEEQTAAELGTASVFVALSHEEGFGLPILEALAAGCPVVGYPAGGGAELFAAPGTHQVADADVIAIVERVAELLGDGLSDRERMSYREWVETNYPVDGQRDRLIEAIGSARAKPARAGMATHPGSLQQPTEPAQPPPTELLERIDALTTRLAELTGEADGLVAELGAERSVRQRFEEVASTLESDLERALRELDRSRRETNLRNEELRDLRCERAELRASADRLVNLEEVTALLAEYKRDNDRLNTRLDNEIRQVHDLETSTSWRFTAPLRRVSGTLRGVRRG